MSNKFFDCPDFQFVSKSHPMYAIIFDLDTDKLQEVYPGDSWRNAYKEIGYVLEENHFSWRQGSAYFGDKNKVTASSCFKVIIELVEQYPWFASSIKDIRMLRIEEDDDLLPRVRQVSKVIQEKPNKK